MLFDHVFEHGCVLLEVLDYWLSNLSRFLYVFQLLHDFCDFLLDEVLHLSLGRRVLIEVDQWLAIGVRTANPVEIPSMLRQSLIGHFLVTRDQSKLSFNLAKAILLFTLDLLVQASDLLLNAMELFSISLSLLFRLRLDIVNLLKLSTKVLLHLGLSENQLFIFLSKRLQFFVDGRVEGCLELARLFLNGCLKRLYLLTHGRCEFIRLFFKAFLQLSCLLLDRGS